MPYEPKEVTILKVKDYTEDVKLFRVKTSMNPLPGQFFQLSILGIGESPLASCSHSSSYVDMLVRKVGKVTTELFKLKAGDKIFLRGPYGNGFDIKGLENKDIILVGGGTGIAPVTSFIEYIEQNRKKFGKISIFFAFRNEEYILLKDRMEKWSKEFDLSICLDKIEGKTKYEKGFVNDIINKKKPNTKNAIAILCGPEPMMKAATISLNKLGLADNKIYWNTERRMECAIGSCGRCMIQDLYTCRDGPVFRYDLIKEKLENEATA